MDEAKEQLNHTVYRRNRHRHMGNGLDHGQLPSQVLLPALHLDQVRISVHFLFKPISMFVLRFRTNSALFIGSKRQIKKKIIRFLLLLSLS